jgi:hypothetical protein
LLNAILKFAFSARKTSISTITVFAILGQAETEEFVLDRWQPADVEEYQQVLVEDAHKSRRAGKSLLLWMSL